METYQNLTPLKQALYVGVLYLLLVGLFSLFPSPSAENSKLMPWTILSAMLLLFATLNTIISIVFKKGTSYYAHSIYSFFGFAILGGFTAYGISGVSLQNAGSISWILGMFAFCFLVLISISNLMKLIFSIIEKHDNDYLKNK
ncbi:MAG: hypothetical protein R2774_09455 [Saprospiraceae bacterium]